MESDTIPFSKRFENSRVRKRFLSQMIPMCGLLRRHGLEADVANTLVRIRRDDRFAFVFLEEGEKRFADTETIFLVGYSKRNYSVASNHMSGVLRTLMRWGFLADGEISEEEICNTVVSACIRCAGCGGMGKRFRQCKMCKDRDDATALPRFRGFYCGSDCQRRDWARHKAEDHE